MDLTLNDARNMRITPVVVKCFRSLSCTSSKGDSREQESLKSFAPSSFGRLSLSPSVSLFRSRLLSSAELAYINKVAMVADSNLSQAAGTYQFDYLPVNTMVLSKRQRRSGMGGE